MSDDFIEAAASNASADGPSPQQASMWGAFDDIHPNMQWVQVATWQTYSDSIAVYAAAMAGQIYLSLGTCPSSAASAADFMASPPCGIGVATAVSARPPYDSQGWDPVPETERDASLAALNGDIINGMSWHKLLADWAGTKANWAGYWEATYSYLYVGIYKNRVFFLPHQHYYNREADSVSSAEKMTIGTTTLIYSSDGGVSYSHPDSIRLAPTTVHPDFSAPLDTAAPTAHRPAILDTYTDSGHHTDDSFAAAIAAQQAAGAYLIASYTSPTTVGTMTPTYHLYVNQNNSNAPGWSIVTCIRQQLNARAFDDDDDGIWGY